MGRDLDKIGSSSSFTIGFKYLLGIYYKADLHPDPDLRRKKKPTKIQYSFSIQKLIFDKSGSTDLTYDNVFQISNPKTPK